MEAVEEERTQARGVDRESGEVRVGGGFRLARAVRRCGGERRIVDRRRGLAHDLPVPPRHGLLEQAGSAVAGHDDGLAVEDDPVDGQLGGHPYDLGHPVGDDVEVAGEHGDPVTGAVDLDAQALQLPLTDEVPSRRDAVAHVGRRRRRIGRTARPTWSPIAASASAPPPECDTAVSSSRPPSMWARRTAVAGTPAALATASTMTPTSAPG